MKTWIPPVLVKFLIPIQNTFQKYQSSLIVMSISFARPVCLVVFILRGFYPKIN